MLDRILMGSSAEASDPNFKNVTLLLHGDGSNGAQNNTFIDSSTNNFTITRNGNTTQGSFSPYGSNWSNYFDGSGDYLYAPYSVTNSEWWTQDFTIEMWVYNNTNAVSSTTSLALQLSHGIATAVDTYWSFGTNASGQLDFYYFNGSANRVTSSASASLNTWNHIAMVYTHSSGNISLYLNGSRVATATKSGTPQNSSGSAINVGVSQNTFYNGYISNLRIIDGTALYSGTTYTVPTAPLTAITNTSLLTCAYNRFRDGSTNNFTITRNGDVKVTNFAPFAPSSAYSTSANGGSAYFDGSGDYLTAASNTAFDVGTGDFTVEFWANWSSVSSTSPGNVCHCVNNGTLGIYVTDSALQIARYNTGGDLTATVTQTTGSWDHYAFTRQSGTGRIFKNGVLLASGTISTNYGQNGFQIGTGVSSAVNGYISNFRFVKGTAVYTAAFTPPTAPVTAITNTSLLLNATNAAIFDNSMKNDLETGANAQISTSVKKFGTGSMYFPNNGSCDFCALPQSPIYAMPGDFTVEFWLYPTLVDANDHCIYDTRASGSDSGAVFFLADTGKIRIFAHGNIRYTSTSAVSANTWSHIAIVRQNGTISSYINGTKDATTSSFSSALTANSTVYVARRMDDANTNGVGTYRGYIDEMRVTPGIARYTANFTPPTAAFPNK